MVDYYPVGSIYINASVATNPATLLGFGTWAAFGAGRVMVGLDAGQTEFDTAEETGGAKTHTLTTGELPASGLTVNLGTDEGRLRCGLRVEDLEYERHDRDEQHGHRRRAQQPPTLRCLLFLETDGLTMANLRIDIEVNNVDANKKLAETDRHVDAIGASSGKTTKATDALETSLGKVAAVTAGVAALKVGFEGIAKVGGASLESFSAQEDALNKLTTALEAQGRATPEVIGQYSALASQFQNTTMFSDELITEMQALLVQVGDTTPQEMGKALKAATDLASGLGIGLPTATKRSRRRSAAMEKRSAATASKSMTPR